MHPAQPQDTALCAPFALLLSLLLPQPTQAPRGPQLQRLCLLTTGNVESFLKTFLRFPHLLPLLHQQELSLAPMQLCLPIALPSVVYYRQRFVQQRQAFFRFTYFLIRLSQQEKKIGSVQF